MPTSRGTRVKAGRSRSHLPTWPSGTGSTWVCSRTGHRWGLPRTTLRRMTLSSTTHSSVSGSPCRPGVRRPWPSRRRSRSTRLWSGWMIPWWTLSCRTARNTCSSGVVTGVSTLTRFSVRCRVAARRLCGGEGVLGAAVDGRTSFDKLRMAGRWRDGHVGGWVRGRDAAPPCGFPLSVAGATAMWGEGWVRGRDAGGAPVAWAAAFTARAARWRGGRLLPWRRTSPRRRWGGLRARWWLVTRSRSRCRR